MILLHVLKCEKKNIFKLVEHLRKTYQIRFVKPKSEKT